MLPIVNQNCVLRRNVEVQPYGRCTVCTLPLRSCHAWQFSLMSFGLIVLVLAVPAVPAGWPLYALVLAILGLIIYQGLVNHRRTDELIYGQHRLAESSARLEEQNRAIEAARADLERAVRERTRELAAANLELIESARARETMIVDLSHELRTPITSIKGAAQNLLDGIAGPVTPPQREYLEIVRDHAERLVRAAESVLQAARGRAAPAAVEVGPVDVAAVARDVSRGVLPVAEARNITLTLSTPAPVVARADAAKLRTVLENLLSNALKFTNPGGRVFVDVGVDGAGWARLAVRDTGVGIDEQEQARVFERYYRAAHDRPGSGVGLALARNLILLQGGELSLRSRVGEGSEFVVALPPGAA